MDHITRIIDWPEKIIQVGGVRFACGHCGADAGVTHMLVGTVQYRHNRQNTNEYADVVFCPVCSHPTYRNPEGKQFPASPLGAALKNLPAGIEGLYREARDCSSVAAYTACVMACRKILMNLAVLEKAAPGGSFVDYVDYLANNGFVPPRGKTWVDRIRKKGNEANHEIKEMSGADAKEIMMLIEMLLRFNFELGDPTP